MVNHGATSWQFILKQLFPRVLLDHPISNRTPCGCGGVPSMLAEVTKHMNLGGSYLQRALPAPQGATHPAFSGAGFNKNMVRRWASTVVAGNPQAVGNIRPVKPPTWRCTTSSSRGLRSLASIACSIAHLKPNLSFDRGNSTWPTIMCRFNSFKFANRETVHCDL